jgi:hypothetical protein
MELNLLLHQLQLGTVIAFYASAFFPGVVAPYWPWWKEFFGWNVVLFDWSFSIVAFPSWLNFTFGVSIRNSAPWATVELFGVWCVILNIVVRAVIIYKFQKKALDRRKQERHRQDATTTRHE